MKPATVTIFSSVNPRVVSAGVPSLSPPGEKADLSPGTEEWDDY